MPVVLDFSQNLQIYNTGATRVSTYQINSRNVRTSQQLSPIKGVLVEYFIAAAFPGSLLRLTVLETRQEAWLGAEQDFATGENVVVQAALPLFCTQPCTIQVDEITSNTGTNINWSKLQFVNFEVKPLVASYANENFLAYPGPLY